MQVGLDKALGLGFKAIQKGGGLVENTKWLKNAAGFLASSPFFDENVINGPKEKRVSPPPSGPLTFIRRYIPTYGYILSLVCGVAYRLLNKLFPVTQGIDGQVQSQSWFVGIGKTLTNLTSLVLPLLTLYSQTKGYQIEYQCPETGKVLQNATKFSDLLQTNDNERLSEAVGKPIRLKKKEEEQVSDTTRNATNSVIKRIYYGPTGTGKTIIMRRDAAKLVNLTGKDKVIVLQVEGQELKTKIELIMKQTGGWMQIADLAGDVASLASEGAGSTVGQVAGNVASWNSTNQVGELKKYFALIKLAAAEHVREAKGNRYLFLLDEIDKLREFAIINITPQNPKGEIDWELLQEISNELKSLFRDPNIDLIATSNIHMNEFFGLSGPYKIFNKREEIEKTALGPAHASIVPTQVLLDKPDLKQQSDIAAGYIIQRQEKLNENDDQFFDKNLVEFIQEKMREGRAKEEVLAEIIKEKIYDSMGNEVKILFENDFRSRDVEFAAQKALNYLFTDSKRNTTKLSIEGIATGLLDIMEKITEKKISLTEVKDVKTTTSIEESKGTSLSQPRMLLEKEVTLDGFVDSLLELSDPQFVHSYSNDEQLRALIHKIIQDNDLPKVRQLKERLERLSKGSH